MTNEESAGIATLHLFTVPPKRIPQALLHMAADARRVRSASGLRFVKLLGTSSGTTFLPQDADLGVWGLFTVWDDQPAADRFDADHGVVRGWRKLATGEARCVLQPIRWKGVWSGCHPFGSDSTHQSSAATTGPIAVLTRARIRPLKLVAFLRAVPPVATDVQTVAGSLLRLGIGEAPIGLQATFSVWEDTAALDQFAYKRTAHREVVRQTAAQRWYSEEMFARFAVKSATGAVRGASMEPIQRLVADPRSG